MNKITAILYGSALLFLAACSVEEPVAEENVSQVLATKAVNTAEFANAGSLLVLMEPGMTPEQVKALFGDEVKSAQRVFPPVAGKEEQMKKHNLDRWYKLTLAEGASLEQAAEAVATVSEVSRVQFNERLVQIGSEYEAVPMSVPFVATKATSDLQACFNDPGFPSQWHFLNKGDKAVHENCVAGADVNVNPAWRVCAGDPRVVVAVVDQGVKYDHPDLADNMWVNEKELNGTPGVDDDGNGYIDDIYGFNFCRMTNEITWDKEVSTGHGTHVAGTIAAVNNNGVGICGIAGGSGAADCLRIMSCQMFDNHENDGSTESILLAIKYAADMGAQILQCSLGYEGNVIKNDAMYKRMASAEFDVLQYFIDQKNCDALDGGIVVFASGNSSYPMASYPGAYRDFICVTATACDMLPAVYTNYGPGCNIAGPGGEVYSNGPQNSGILSTVPAESFGTDYAFFQGTSMACPHVTGVAALGLAHAIRLGKKFTTEEFKSLLLTSVKDLETYMDRQTMKNFGGISIDLEPYRNNMGTGLVDAWKFLMAIEGTPSVMVKAGSTSRVDLRPFFGDAAKEMTFIKAEASEEDEIALGIESLVIQSGSIDITCFREGCGKIRVSAIGGGSRPGTDSNVGGMTVTREISVISRAEASSNGGWL